MIALLLLLGCPAPCVEWSEPHTEQRTTCTTMPGHQIGTVFIPGTTFCETRPIEVSDCLRREVSP